MKKPLLLGTFGYPGSGKTYFSERLAKKENFFHLSSDRIRLMMFEKSKYNLSEHKIVFQFMDYLAEEFLKHGVSVIYDANFNQRKHRRKLERMAKQTKSDYRLLWIRTDEKTALKRLEKRAKLKDKVKKWTYRPIDLHVFKHLKNEMELPTKAEKVIEINGHLPFSRQLKSVSTQLEL